MPDEKDIRLSWNNSKIESILRCAEAFRRRYVEGEIVPPGVAMLRGSTVHAVARENFRARLEPEGEPFTVEQARDLAATDFAERWAGGVSFTDEERAEGLTKVRGETKDAAVDLAGLHAKEVAPCIEPVAVEEQILVTPKGTNLLLHGTIDLQERVVGGIGIRDLKSKTKSPSKTEADDSPQLTLYALLVTAKTGRPPVNIALDHLVRTPEKHLLRWVEQRTERGKEDFQALINRIGAAANAVSKGVFLPASERDWFCSPVYCGYYDAGCPYVSRKKRPVS